ncbi:hypothetical protein DPX16_19066 [Anabarilius grahami]|uniref:Uncharacterized protein n=1 Tax=Anabarilius grahami TaxID=495550 RepID=A0A3N0YVN5_ANAGA|nr:hypothetical protein DPX16_19066 [Anabarilius grahami]
MQSFDRPSNHHAEARSPGQPTPHSPPETLSVLNRIQVRPRTGALTGPQRSPEVSAEIESTRSSIVKDSTTRQPVAQFLNKPSIPA